jgi:uncharacterized SAM-binding protein YcdF (DUF218 family)
VKPQVLKLLRWALVVWVLLTLLHLLVVVCLPLVRLQVLLVVVRHKCPSVKLAWRLEAYLVDYLALVELSSEVLSVVSLEVQSLVQVYLVELI